MEELIYLLIKLLAQSGSKSGAAVQQQEQARQARIAWEQRQAWEQLQRQRAVQAPPPLPPPRGKRRGARGGGAAPAVAPPSVGSLLAEAEPVLRVAPAKAPSAVVAPLAGLKQPRTLREQFVLTEILRPPVALRPPRV